MPHVVVTCMYCNGAERTAVHRMDTHVLAPWCMVTGIQKYCNGVTKLDVHAVAWMTQMNRISILTIRIFEITSKVKATFSKSCVISKRKTDSISQIKLGIYRHSMYSTAITLFHTPSISMYFLPVVCCNRHEPEYKREASTGTTI